MQRRTLRPRPALDQAVAQAAFLVHQVISVDASTIPWRCSSRTVCFAGSRPHGVTSRDAGVPKRTRGAP